MAPKFMPSRFYLILIKESESLRSQSSTIVPSDVVLQTPISTSWIVVRIGQVCRSPPSTQSNRARSAPLSFPVQRCVDSCQLSQSSCSSAVGSSHRLLAHSMSIACIHVPLPSRLVSPLRPLRIGSYRALTSGGPLLSLPKTSA